MYSTSGRHLCALFLMLCKCRSFHLALVHSVTCQVDVPDPDYFKLWWILVQALYVEQMSALSFVCLGTTLHEELGWSAVTTEPFCRPTFEPVTCSCTCSTVTHSLYRPQGQLTQLDTSGEFLTQPSIWYLLSQT